MDVAGERGDALRTENGDLSTVRKYARLFGECVAEYENARPGYPDGLVRKVLVAAVGAESPCSVLEVGAGSGKATIPIAATGHHVQCIEPSRRMAAVLRQKCSAFPNVSIAVTSFERWRPRQTYTHLVAAQSWHLIDPALRIEKAALALRERGVIALMWNQPPQPVRDGDRRQLAAVLAEAGIDLTGPQTAATTHRRETHGRIYVSEYFDPAEPTWYRTLCTLSLGWYTTLLQTYPEYRMMRISEQRRLLSELGRTVFNTGSLPATYYTVLHMASRTAVPCEESAVVKRCVTNVS